MGILLPEGLAVCKAYYRFVQGKALIFVSSYWDLKVAAPSKSHLWQSSADHGG